MNRLAMLTLVLLVLVGCSPSIYPVLTEPVLTEPVLTEPVLTEYERMDMVYWKDEQSEFFGGGGTLEYKDGRNMNLSSSVLVDHEGNVGKLILHYYMDADWLSVDSFVINADGERYYLDLCHEESDFACLELSDKELVKQIVGADIVMFRIRAHYIHSGEEGFNDFKLTALEKTSIGYAFQTFANLKEGTIEMKEGIKSGEEIWWK